MKTQAIIPLLALLELFVPRLYAQTGFPSETESRLRLSSVHAHNGYIFASNAAGIFRADAKDKIWHKIATPAVVAPSGQFVRGDTKGADIFYFANQWGMPNFPERSADLLGLYQSSDNGETWKPVIKRKNLCDALVLPSGRIFVAFDSIGAREPNAKCEVLESGDDGKTWRQIYEVSGGTFGGLWLLADPDHPDLVCISYSSIRGYILQAEDPAYTWKSTREWEWEAAHETEQTFFRRRYSTTSTLYMMQATLQNYFKYDFDDASTIPSFDLGVEKAAYEFPRIGAKKIKVVVRFLVETNISNSLGGSDGTTKPLPRPTVNLIDQDDQRRFWNLRIITPSGLKVVTSSGKQRTPEKNGKMLVTTTPDDQQRGTHMLGIGESYSREIDLAANYDFPESGTYKVQLGYSSIGEKDSKEVGWGGQFWSKIFRVVVP